MQLRWQCFVKESENITSSQPEEFPVEPRLQWYHELVDVWDKSSSQQMVLLLNLAIATCVTA